MLGVFSPCNALLLLALLANFATSRAMPLRPDFVFPVGLLVVLVPPGLGLGWLGGTFTLDCGLLLNGAGWLLIALGLLTAFGGGTNYSRPIPGKPRPVAGSLAGVFALGAYRGLRASARARSSVQFPR